MDEQAKTAIVRIYKRQGDRAWPIGCGFLAADRTVLTCRHVIIEALRPETDLLGKEVVLDFPFPHGSALLKARVILPFDQPDLAKLELLSSPPETATPMPLSAEMDLWLDPYSAYGITLKEPDGFWDNGEIKSSIGDSTLQIESKSVYKIEQGFSGTAVWDEEIEKAVGMVAKIDIDPKTEATKAAFAVPMADILERCPELKPLADTAQTKAPLPAIWNIPFQRNLNFSGRKEILADLALALRSGEPGAWKQALWGMGGVGKTQIALEYAYSHKPDYRVVWWLRSEEASTLLSDYAQLAPKLYPESGPVADLNAARDAVKAWLQQNEKWLLIFDNAQNPEAIKDFMPGDGPGHVIITSRSQEWGQLAKEFPIRIFEREESVNFILDRTRQQDKETADALADELGDLPLALEQAVSYIGATSTSLAEYLDLFKKRRKELWEQEEKPIDYPDTVATTWDLAMKEVGKEPGAADILNLCAFLAPDEIPFELLTVGGDALPPNLSAIVIDKLAFNRVLKTLKRYSLIESDGKVLSVHRLVQAVVRDKLGEDRKEWTKTAVALLSHAFTFEKDDLATWDKSERLYPHLLAAASHAEELEVAYKETQHILNEAALYSQNRADFLGAKNQLERALILAEIVFGPDHPDVATIANNLGSVLKDLGDLPNARQCFERALKIDERIYGPEHPHVAMRAGNLGKVLRDLGDLEGAKNNSELALEIMVKAYSSNHPHIATALSDLGSTLRELGELHQARKCFERAMKIDEMVYGPEHPLIAAIAHNLGLILKDLGDLTNARQYIERALRIDEIVYGLEHPNVASDVNSLGSVLRVLGDLTKARQCFERALEIFRENLGDDHSLTRIAANNLNSVPKG
jgi:tetratricopeptide (TPR) repeat protein